MSEGRGPLGAVRVLELSRILAGPWAGQTLADLGAEVIKVERPGTGDDTRTWGPPFAQRGADGSINEAAYFLAANRGKRSVTIDFTRPEGRDLVRALVARSDVLIENFKVGGLSRYQLDYASLREANPRLVYCSITGFGQTGPYRHRPGYDFLIQGMSGLMSITGLPDDAPGGGPMKVGVAVSDLFAGLYAVIAIQAALSHRDRTGAGQHVDIALFDTQVATLANQSLNYLVSGTPPARLGNAHPNIVPYQAFAASGGHLILAVGNDEQFARFCDVAGRPELSADARFATNPDRVKNREVLIEILGAVFRERSRDEWIAELERVGVPCGPIQDIEQAFNDPQVKARGLRLSLPDGDEGTLPGVATPISYSATPLRYDRAPPRLGEHTHEVLEQELGLSGADIDALRAAGVLEARDAKP